MTKTSVLMTEIQRQQKYLDKLPSDFNWPLFNTKVALESMRQSAYQTTAAAAREIVDNSIEAGASEIHVVIRESKAKSGHVLVDAIAFYDNGSGMLKDMARYALTWGAGTHYDDPRFLGRFGFGLPNASINQTRLVEVFTRTADDAPIIKAWLDLDEIEDNGIQSIPEPGPAGLPDWIKSYLDRNKLEFNHGTVVVWQKPDRLTYRRPARLKEHLVDDFGSVYRYLLLGARQIRLVVQGVDVEPVDPLFLQQDARYYETPLADQEAPKGGGSRQVAEWFIPVRVVLDPETGERKVEKVDSISDIDVDDANLRAYGTINVRMARFPIGFATDEGVSKDDPAFKRLQIRKTRRGVSFVRANREIETVDVFPKSARDPDQGLGEWPLLQTYAYHWGMEVKFGPELDQVFGITNDKQGVRPAEDLWRIFAKEGIDDAARRENNWQAAARKMLRNVQPPAPDPDQPSLAEKAAQDADIATSDRPEVPDHRKAAAEEHLQQTAAEKVKATGRPLSEVIDAIQKAATKRRYKVEFYESADGPFYEPVWVGEMIVVRVNTMHPFYSVLYRDLLQLHGGARAQAAIDVMLIALARAELTAGNADMAEWYNTQRRRRWSPYLEDALTSLVRRLDSALGQEAEEATA